MPFISDVSERIRQLRRSAPMQDFPDYDAYWEKRVTVGFTMERWKVAAQLIPEGATVLDVGSGSCEFLEHLRSVRPGVHATGCDFSETAVTMARDLGFDAFQLDLASSDIPETYDYLTCFEVLEHIPNAEDALLRLKAACRRRVIVSVPNIGYIDNRLRLALYGRFPITNCIYHIKEHVRHWAERDFREWASHFGMRVVAVEGQGGGRFFPWRQYPGLWSRGLVYVLEPEGVDGS